MGRAARWRAAGAAPRAVPGRSATGRQACAGRASRLEGQGSGARPGVRRRLRARHRLPPRRLRRRLRAPHRLRARAPLRRRLPLRAPHRLRARHRAPLRRRLGLRSRLQARSLRLQTPFGSFGLGRFGFGLGRRGLAGLSRWRFGRLYRGCVRDLGRRRVAGSGGPRRTAGPDSVLCHRAPEGTSPSVAEASPQTDSTVPPPSLDPAETRGASR